MLGLSRSSVGEVLVLLRNDVGDPTELLRNIEGFFGKLFGSRNSKGLFVVELRKDIEGAPLILGVPHGDSWMS